MSQIVSYESFAACLAANKEAREQGHPVGAYDDPQKLQLGWYDHKTRTAHVIGITRVKEVHAGIPLTSFGDPEAREQLFGGKQVPKEALELKAMMMPSFIQVTEAPVIFLPEIMVSVTDMEGNVLVKTYRLAD